MIEQHNLNIVDGAASMFYVAGEGLPWHGLGNGVDNALTGREAITAAGLGYTVDKVALMTDSLQMVKSHVATRRSDTGEILGVVGQNYKVVQNAEAFDFMDNLVAEGLRYHTAGALGKGDRIWMLATLPGEVRTASRDARIAALPRVDAAR